MNDEERSKLERALSQKMAWHMSEIKKLYDPRVKVTLYIRCPWIIDADLIMSNEDDAPAMVNALTDLVRRRESEKNT